MFAAAVLLVLLAALVAAALYWLLILSEGVYLGERMVIWLYDLYAGRYDRIKEWDAEDERLYVAAPFAAAVGARRHPPLILDVGSGTGRLERAVEAAGLLPEARWVLLDGSRRMLALAQEELDLGERGRFLHHRACPLPFADETFDVVACLEALEFTPRPEATLAELVRVLRPGGLLVITNRVGPGVRWLPGRTWSRPALLQRLRELDQKHISVRPTWEDYEWVSSLKAGAYQAPGRGHDLTRLQGL